MSMMFSCELFVPLPNYPTTIRKSIELSAKHISMDSETIRNPMTIFMGHISKAMSTTFGTTNATHWMRRKQKMRRWWRNTMNQFGRFRNLHIRIRIQCIPMIVLNSLIFRINANNHHFGTTHIIVKSILLLCPSAMHVVTFISGDKKCNFNFSTLWKAKVELVISIDGIF